jgi:hypothetical protein
MGNGCERGLDEAGEGEDEPGKRKSFGRLVIGILERWPLRQSVEPREKDETFLKLF